jgi:hypothetical protein
MTDGNPVTMLVTYRPKPRTEDALLSLIREHWPTLNRLGLATIRPPKLWRAVDKRTGRTFFVEIFEWRDASASEIAHQTPEVMAVWEPMGPLLEEMSLARIEPVETP